ncbi:biotin-dependent carboxyltransferase family protein [uncultured Propionivibrio sp.]|uniref:5-oxoprolinase subunit C family protein n=1 Tax=uncultured Propionivibrio sp. TaxID=426737 RepID=UPI0029BFF718|nr:biotin-dependent carboxyltransferase family protein [uncultured Propionivibrio sp.]
MNGLVEVVNAGIANSLQDQGRIGYRHMGIAVSGCLDPWLARCANALVGNDADCACIEIRAAGPSLAVLNGPLRFALAGTATATRVSAEGDETEVLPWQSVALETGEELQVGFQPGGTAYLAVSGGFATPVQLGSRSTYLRAEIGAAINFGLQIPCELASGPERAAVPWSVDAGPVRVVLGPQDDHFTPAALEDFLAGEYRVTPQSDRMGLRLEGTALVHRSAAAADIVSDGVTPGVIQVPANGQPIILLADCQTVGGYPKIATVISADLPRLAQLRPGEAIRFIAVDAVQAAAARTELAARWQAWVGDIR